MKCFFRSDPLADAMTLIPTLPDFASTAFLDQHMRDIMAFYDSRCVDPAGGFFHFFRDDGSVYDRRTRHLVSSTRFVVNYARAARHWQRADYLELVRHGLDFIEQVHWQSATGGYAWLLEDGKPVDATNHCYGLAFVILAYAEALKAGVAGAAEGLARANALLVERFWSEQHGLLADEYDATFTTLSPYRGQNANMHGCEALISAFEASGDEAYLTRAVRIADGVTAGLAAQSDGLVWEHYDSNWRVDWDYNRDDPRHLFRPWGFQPGHQTEWSKLLLILHRYRPDAAMAARAKMLFERAVTTAWDSERGGLYYGFAADASICDSDKYFWVQAESLAAAALLDEQFPGQGFDGWYDRLWQYSWTHLVDHRYGAWYRILDENNRKYGDEKSPAGKTDYHTYGACAEVLESLRRQGRA
jgi:mannose/cellobiose epimerase-like protein (N-acyl-D-glucosamine 2-epimerase family)